MLGCFVLKAVRSYQGTGGRICVLWKSPQLRRGQKHRGWDGGGQFRQPWRWQTLRRCHRDGVWVGRRSAGGLGDGTGGGPWLLPLSPNLQGGWGRLNWRMRHQAISAMPGMCFIGGESGKWCFKNSSRKEIWEPSPSLEQKQESHNVHLSIFFLDIFLTCR